MLPVWYFGLGFWWVWMTWFFDPNPLVPVPYELGTARIAVMVGFALTSLGVALLGGRLAPLYRRRHVLGAALCLGSVGTMLASFSALGISDLQWIYYVGLLAIGLALGPLYLVWMEFLGTGGVRLTGIVVSCSAVLGAALYLVFALVARLNVAAAVVLMATMPWLSCMSLQLSWKNADSPMRFKASARQVSVRPTIVEGAGLLYGLATGLMLSMIIPGSAGLELLVLSGHSQALALGSVGLFMLIRFRPSSRETDPGRLYRPVLPLFVVGFLLLPVMGASRLDVAGAIIGAGFILFYLLSSIMFVEIASRLEASALRVAGWGNAATAFGMAMGVAIHYVVVGTAFLWVSQAVAIVLVGVNSFALTERSISSLGGLLLPLPARPDTCFKAIGEKYSLTPREQEVLALLAKGRNAEYVQKALVISVFTAQTHIRHVYKKLGVHSQQKLIDLVEEFDSPVGLASVDDKGV
ncbi:MAG: hypothetical protein HGA39_04710 [Coriobacteriia bacterium]|nr:hypothetical protein [Coriobacteriia bacterium]